MSIYLVVNVLNVFYHAANAKTVSASDDMTGSYTLQSTSEEGKYEAKLADGVTSITITVAQDGYVTTVQQLTLSPGSAAGVTPVVPPGLAFGSTKQELWMRNVGGSSRGTDWNVEAYFVLGQLTDAQSQVDAIAKNAAAPVPLTASTVPVMQFSKLILAAAGTSGWSRFAHTVANIPAPGKLFFAARLGLPSLVAIFVPDGVVVPPTSDRNDASFKPLNIHLFLGPSTDNPGNQSTSYPYDRYYIDLVFRYLFNFRYLGKNLVNQQAASGKTPILIFPIPDRKVWFNRINSQGALLELIYEVRFFIQRMFDVPYPNQPVGKLALSGFSTSGQYVSQALVHTNDFFHHNLLTEVYGFDLRGATAAGFAHNLKSWFNASSGKNFRIYTQLDDWYNATKNIDPTATTTAGGDGAALTQGNQSSVVHLPFFYFWNKLNTETGQPADFQNLAPFDYQIFRSGTGRSGQDDVHQLFPSLFVEHALSQANFPARVT